MKLYVSLILFLVSTFAFGANIGDDSLNLGNAINTATDKALIFNDGSAASARRRISIDGVTKNLKSNSNNFELGDNIAGDKSLIFRRGGSSPEIKWNDTLGRFESSADGTLYKAFGSGSGSGSDGVNLIGNSGFEDGISLDWLFTGGTFTQQTYSNTTENNTKFSRFVASTSGQFFRTTARVIPTFLGVGCMADIQYLTSNNAAFKVMALDGSANILAEQILPSNTVIQRSTTLTFPCPAAAATVELRVQSLAAGTIDSDNGYIGGNKNLVSISQARIAGESFFAGTASCNWARTSTTIGAFATLAACPGPTIVDGSIGVWQTTDSDLPRQTINNLPAGKYKAKFIFSSFAGGLNVLGAFAINDGTTTCEAVAGNSATATTASTLVECVFSYASSGNRVFELFTASASGASTVSNSAASAPRASTKFILEYFPDDSQTAITSDQSGWFIDANIGGASPNLGTSNITSYTEITDVGLDLVPRSGSASAEIACIDGTSSVGLTCNGPAVAESVGIAFTPPYTGYFDVCVNFTHAASGTASNMASVVFQLIETPNSSTTILQEGGQKTGLGGNNSAQANNGYNTGNFCGTFLFSSITKRTIRLEREQSVTGAPLNTIAANRSASLGQIDIRFTVKPSTMNIARPVLTGDQVTAKGAVNTDIQRVFFGSGANCATPCTTGNCTICRQVGNRITSVSFVSTGAYNVNGLDGTKYECNGNGFGAANYNTIFTDLGSSTVSFVRVSSGVGGAQDNTRSASLTCIGIP